MDKEYNRIILPKSLDEGTSYRTATWVANSIHRRAGIPVVYGHLHKDTKFEKGDLVILGGVGGHDTGLRLHQELAESGIDYFNVEKGYCNWWKPRFWRLTFNENQIKEVKGEILRNNKRLKIVIPKIGVLIETPAAALISGALAKNCDFFAIGTNDLTMYTLAIDRGDEEVAKIYDPGHLSVLKLIHMTSRSADRNKIPVSICGEMAGDTLFTSILIGMGIRTLSMSTSRILKVKQYLSQVNSNEVKKISDDIFKSLGITFPPYLS